MADRVLEMLAALLAIMFSTVFGLMPLVLVVVVDYFFDLRPAFFRVVTLTAIFLTGFALQEYILFPEPNQADHPYAITPAERRSGLVLAPSASPSAFGFAPASE